MEKLISMDSKLFNFHKFEKFNLVTNKDGTDTYICKDCELKGKRFGLDDYIKLIRPSKIKLLKCNGKKGTFEINEKEKPKIEKDGLQIQIINDTHLSNFGFKIGDKLETVKYPKNQEQGLSGVWVKSLMYEEAVRLMDNEYKIIKDELENKEEL
jgi:hypothetical protein